MFLRIHQFKFKFQYIFQIRVKSESRRKLPKFQSPDELLFIIRSQNWRQIQVSPNFSSSKVQAKFYLLFNVRFNLSPGLLKFSD